MGNQPHRLFQTFVIFTDDDLRPPLSGSSFRLDLSYLSVPLQLLRSSPGEAPKRATPQADACGMRVLVTDRWSFSQPYHNDVIPIATEERADVERDPQNLVASRINLLARSEGRSGTGFHIGSLHYPFVSMTACYLGFAPNWFKRLGPFDFSLNFSLILICKIYQKRTFGRLIPGIVDQRKNIEYLQPTEEHVYR